MSGMAESWLAAANERPGIVARDLVLANREGVTNEVYLAVVNLHDTGDRGCHNYVKIVR